MGAAEAGAKDGMRGSPDRGGGDNKFLGTRRPFSERWAPAGPWVEGL